MGSILKRALRYAFSDYVSDYDSLLKRAGLVSLELGRQRAVAIETYKSLNGLAPKFLADIFKTLVNVYRTRQSNQLCVPSVKSTHFGLHSIRYLSAKIWNTLPNDIVMQDTLTGFNSSIMN